MQNPKFSTYQDLIALVAGAILPFAFAPFNYYFIAIFSTALLLRTWIGCPPRRALIRGLYFGIGYFGVGVSWVYISIHEFGDTPALLAAFITALFILILSLFPALQGYILAKFFPKNNISKFCLAFPTSWALIEYGRSLFATGFPWLLLGASQTESPLSGLAPIVGEFGLSFFTALTGALLLMAIRAGWRHSYKQLFLIVIIWGCAGLLTDIEWTKPLGNPFQTSLVQGNIPQQIKWTPDYLRPTLDKYVELTAPHWDSQLIIWPEAAIPALLQNVKPFIQELSTTATMQNVAFITGIPIVDGFDYYNAMLLLTDNTQQLYYKQHLVPFGEYVPLGNLLRGLIGLFNIPMSNFSSHVKQFPPLKFNGITIAPFICYEIAYLQEVLQDFPAANLIVTISNDAWFGQSFASAQHLQIGQLRALETGRYHLFTANSGLTAIINPKGKIQNSIPPNEAAVLTGTAQAMQGATPLVYIGLFPILGLIGLCLVVAFWYQRKA